MWSLARFISSLFSPLVPEVLESSGSEVATTHPWVSNVVSDLQTRTRVRVAWERPATLSFLRGVVGTRRLWVLVWTKDGTKEYLPIFPAVHASSNISGAVTLVADHGDIRAIIEVSDIGDLCECSAWVGGDSADLGTLCQLADDDGLGHYWDFLLRVQTQVQLDGRSVVCTPDLLLEVTRTQGIAQKYLESFGVTTEKVQAFSVRNESSHSHIPVPFSSSAEVVMDRAQQHAQGVPTPNDMLYGIMSLETCEARRILIELGVSPEEMARNIRSIDIW